MQQIQVSVYCTVYNHEKYLKKCLDGFVMQKTNFSFEVLVHDDASTDNSPEIILQYAKRYPDIIKPIIQKENQYSKGHSIVKEFIFPKVRGKYLAICEGDDYWCDEYKLQKQYDAMELHPECHLCLHTVRKVSEDDTRNLGFYPSFELSEGVLDQKQFFNYIGKAYAFQTSCYFRRTKDFEDYYRNPPVFTEVADVGDIPMMLYCGLLGNVYYINSIMSCYRMESIGSWSSNLITDTKKRLRHADAMVKMYDEFNKFSDMLYQEEFAQTRRHFYLSTFLYRKDEIDCARYLCKKENRDFLKEISIVGRIMIYLRAYLPKVAKILLIIKGKIR